MNESGVGTLKWAERTGGRLSGGDRLQPARTGGSAAGLGILLAFEEEIWRSEADRLPTSTAVRIPDSRIARTPRSCAARCHRLTCSSTANGPICGGASWAGEGGIRYDEELFYVASLLHDLGATSRYPGEGLHCFGVVSAMAARDFVRAREWRRRELRAVAEAISLHLNVSCRPGARPGGAPAQRRGCPGRDRAARLGARPRHDRRRPRPPSATRLRPRDGCLRAAGEGSPAGRTHPLSLSVSAVRTAHAAVPARPPAGVHPGAHLVSVLRTASRYPLALEPRWPCGGT